MVPTTGAGNGWQNERRGAEKVSHLFPTQMCTIFTVVIEINNIFWSSQANAASATRYVETHY